MAQALNASWNNSAPCKHDPVSQGGPTIHELTYLGPSNQGNVTVHHLGMMNAKGIQASRVARYIGMISDSQSTQVYSFSNPRCTSKCADVFFFNDPFSTTQGLAVQTNTSAPTFAGPAFDAAPDHSRLTFPPTPQDTKSATAQSSFRTLRCQHRPLFGILKRWKGYGSSAPQSGKNQETYVNSRVKKTWTDWPR